MNISSESLSDCLDQANTVAARFQHLSIDKNAYPRSIKELLKAFEDAIGSEVEVLQVNITKEEGCVLGMCVLSPGKVQIALAKDLNECWMRFVLCKELFHAVLDRPEYRNISIDGHIEEITLAFPDDDSRPRKPVVAEFLAEIGAMELLFPFKKRAAILAQPAKPDFLVIAQELKIPKVLVQRYISNSYIENLSRFSKL